MFYIDGKRGQASVEYLIIAGFVVFLVVSILGFAFFYSLQISEAIRFNNIAKYADKIISSSERIFLAGEPSRVTELVYLPAGVNSIELIENNLIFSVSTSYGVSKVSFPSDVPLDFNGGLSVDKGVKRIQLIAEADRVRIIEG